MSEPMFTPDDPYFFLQKSPPKKWPVAQQYLELSFKVNAGCQNSGEGDTMAIQAH